MPRTFALTARYQPGVEDVYAAFRDEGYWRARLADSGADVAALDSIEVGPDGVAVTTTQAISRHRLPGLATQFLPGDLTVVRTESWGPLRGAPGNRANGAGGFTWADAVVTGEIPHAPARLTGSGSLRGDARGCAAEFSVTVHVDVPLVGGKIESFIGSQLRDLIAAEQRFTSAWILHSGHGTAN